MSDGNVDDDERDSDGVSKMATMSGKGILGFQYLANSSTCWSMNRQTRRLKFMNRSENFVDHSVGFIDQQGFIDQRVELLANYLDTLTNRSVSWPTKILINGS